MPLHLLSKKSWNVYAPENRERVRRDEAAEAAREAEERRRMQELDAARRIAILRGEKPLLSEPEPEPETERTDKRDGRDNSGSHRGRDRKRRRLAGENDTDRDIRLAKEDTDLGSAAQDRLISAAAARRRAARDAPITDHAGHISLFPEEQVVPKVSDKKNAEAEAEAAKKRREYEDQYTMRFSNAAGKEGLEKPWYAASGAGSARDGKVEKGNEESEPRKDVWGNADPRRREREKVRMGASDPLAFMKKAQNQLRDAERDKLRWAEAKERELRELDMLREREENHKRRRKSRRESNQDNLELDGFSLDNVKGDDSRYQSRGDSKSSRHALYRSRSPRKESERHYSRQSSSRYV